MKAFRWLWVLAFLGCCLHLAAQDPLEKERVLCDPADPATRCPGPQCLCAPDTLEVTFDGKTDSVFEYETFEQGMVIEVTIVTETRSAGVQGWSYGVAHDEEALRIQEVTLAGTDVEFVCTWSLPCMGESVDFETCGDDPECAPENRTPGGGWISAVVLSFRKPLELEIRRNTIGRATYGLRKDVGPEGTLIRFSDRLARPGSPRMELQAGIDGRTRLWSTAIDGWVKREGVSPAFRRGDADGSGRLNILDAVLSIQSLFGHWKPPADCDDTLDSDDDGKLSLLDPQVILSYLFQRGPALPAPFGACEPDPTADSLTCRESNCASP